jgi:hypothetical protein
VHDVEVGEREQRLAPRVAPALRDGERAHVGLAGLLARLVDLFAHAAETHPHVGPRRDPARQLLERERQLRVEPPGLAGVGEQREADGRARHLREERVGLRPGAHRLLRRQRRLALL